MRKIAILGSTGSVGRAALRVARHLKDEIKVVALAAKSNLDLLEEQAREFEPELIAIGDEANALEFKRRFSGEVPIVAEEEGLCAAASIASADLTLLAMSGIAGLKPAIAAMKSGKEIGLANKELLVCAGEFFMQCAEKYGALIIPVDSEHSALFQCLQGQRKESVRRLILTASGGPFLNRSEEELSLVTLEEALMHPNWSMGQKITIDSSTLMNKGFEMIEAHWLFGLPPSAIEVVVHPQSVIHSLVEFCDGAMLAQMSQPDMALPIQFALTYPRRSRGMLPPFDFSKYSQLTFQAPDRKRFPCLALAEEAIRRGKSFPCVLNAANDILVSRFLKKEIAWVDLGRKLEKLISSHSGCDVITLEAILAVDQEIRGKARDF